MEGAHIGAGFGTGGLDIADGTLLWAANLFPNTAVPPIIGFSLGSLGFLTPFDIRDMERCIEKVLAGNCHLTLRSRLRCRVVRRVERLSLATSTPSLQRTYSARHQTYRATSDALPIPSFAQLEQQQQNQAQEQLHSGEAGVVPLTRFPQVLDGTHMAR